MKALNKLSRVAKICEYAFSAIVCFCFSAIAFEMVVKTGLMENIRRFAVAHHISAGCLQFSPSLKSLALSLP